MFGSRFSRQRSICSLGVHIKRVLAIKDDTIDSTVTRGNGSSRVLLPSHVSLD